MKALIGVEMRECYERVLARERGEGRGAWREYHANIYLPAQSTKRMG